MRGLKRAVSAAARGGHGQVRRAQAEEGDREPQGVCAAHVGAKSSHAAAAAAAVDGATYLIGTAEIRDSRRMKVI